MVSLVGDSFSKNELAASSRCVFHSELRVYRAGAGLTFRSRYSTLAENGQYSASTLRRNDSWQNSIPQILTIVRQKR